jgi:aminopeptidase YwaD
MVATAETHLRKLCLEIPGRHVGSPGNQAATDYFARIAVSFGFQVETQAFDCMDWCHEAVRLSVGALPFEVFASPYSLGCHVSAPLLAASTVDELESVDAADKILLLRDDLTRQQLMPKNFPFYNPDEHKRIIQLLETKAPAAIIAATTRDLEMVGSMYPFPLIEDGDFDIPSVYMTEEEGMRLAARVGTVISLESHTQRIPTRGCNVVARKRASAERRVVFLAHIDSKLGTPGAIDNASGVIVLLLLAELLAQYSGELGVEIVALNGEDYYSNPGEQQYLALNTGRFDDILLGINIDGVGYVQGDIAYTLYDCPFEVESTVRRSLSVYQGMVEGEPWYQGDHMLFLMNQRPALAFTSELAAQLMAQVIHTPKDSPEIVNASKLVKVAVALSQLLPQLNRLLV